MKNLTKVLGGTAAAFLLMAGFASAATISDPLLSNAQTTIDATGGATVSGTMTLTVAANETVEWLRCQSDTMPFTDVSLGGPLGDQEGVYFNVPFQVKVSPNTGDFNIDCQGSGTFGGNRSINGGDNVVVGPTNVGMVRVVAGGILNSGGSSVSSTEFNTLLKMIQDLTNLFASSTAKTGGPAKASCPPSLYVVGTSALQSWLVDHSFMTQAEVDTGPGIDGPKTKAATGRAQNACL